MKKFLFLAMLCCIAMASCTRIERIPRNEDMTVLHDKWKDLYGVEIDYEEALPIEYDSISLLGGNYNHYNFIAYKPEKHELYELRSTETPKLLKLAESYRIERISTNNEVLTVLIDKNGKKTVYGKPNGYEPFDEVYPAIGGYIFEKDGLFGYNDIVPPKYKKIAVVTTWTDRYLFSEDGVTYSVYEYTGKRFKKITSISVAEVEEYGDKYAEFKYSPYSFGGISQDTPYEVWNAFHKKLDGR